MKIFGAIIVFTLTIFLSQAKASTVVDCRYINANSSGVIIATSYENSGIAQYISNGAASKKFQIRYQISFLETFPAQSQVLVSLEAKEKSLMINFFGAEVRGKGYLVKGLNSRPLEMTCTRGEGG